MARRKKHDNETVDETTERRLKEEISNNANRSEKTSWNRKMDNMVKLLAEIRPIEEQIIELNEKKIPIFDEIQEIRKQMLQDCIHPYEYVLLETNHAKCKFCEKKISLPNLDNI
jgi:mannose-6-phosphate isomerase class I